MIFEIENTTCSIEGLYSTLSYVSDIASGWGFENGSGDGSGYGYGFGSGNGEDYDL